jgi:septum site-determining protein MinC
MLSNSNSSPQAASAFELKGRMLTLSVLKLLSVDLNALADQLDAKLRAAPGLLKQLPVLLDLEAVAGQAIDFDALVKLLRGRELMPIGVRAPDEAHTQAAAAAGLGVINAGSEAKRSEPVREKPEPAAGAGLIVRQPIRSGQQVYARGGDLVVLAPVSAGAEILADGHIHVYGALRGRALAGVQGNTQARIFCQSLDAELISIAGNYRVSENIQDAERGRPVQIVLNGDALVIEPL